MLPFEARSSRRIFFPLYFYFINTFFPSFTSEEEKRECGLSNLIKLNSVLQWPEGAEVCKDEYS